MYYTYVIKSLKNNSFYVGLTNKVQRRITEHNTVKVRSTKAYIPYKLMHQEQFSTRLEARTREKYLKSGCGKEWLKSQYL